MPTGVAHDHEPAAGAAGRFAASAASGRPWALPAAVGAALAVGTAGVVALGPSDDAAPICLSRTVFGVDCPLCGGLRCVARLAAGDLLGAADHNVLLAVALPLVTVAWAVWMARALVGRPTRLPRPPAWSLVAGGVVVVAFGVLRNLGDGGVLGWLAAGAS